MLPIAIFAILGLSLFMMGGDDVADDTDDDDFEVLPGETVTGTDGDDLFTMGIDDTLSGSFSVDAGAGNDVVDFTDPSGAYIGQDSDYHRGGDIHGGAGDDTITAGGSWDVEGGAGDDTIYIQNGSYSNIYGGEGDDNLSAEVTSDGATLYGDTGDDMIDARQVHNGRLYGGDGNDVFMTSNQGTAGAGYRVAAYGGEGDDHFIHDADLQSDHNNPPLLWGEEGNDHFEIAFSEEHYSEDTTSEILGFDIVELQDFEPGVDTIEIVPETVDSAYAVTSARLVEDAESGVTNLIVHYENDTEADLDMTVVIHATNVTWDDITFVGDNIPPVLVPV